MLYIARHVECKANVAGVYAGITESDITSRGKTQAASLKKYFMEIPLDYILTSPTKRALYTAMSVAKGTESLIVTDALQELDGGAWENKPFSYITKQSDYQKFMTDMDNAAAPNGETIHQLYKRIESVTTLLNHFHQKSILVVTHGYTSKAILSKLLGSNIMTTPWQANAAVHALAYENGNWQMVKNNDCSHLPAQLQEFNIRDWNRLYEKNASSYAV